jgi:hypothetical protein|tara:strand:- start:1700 stop:2290 length:591 start_codon:yes stop_codon:yes gene_type:complete
MTSTVANTSIDIASRAMVLIGANTITSFTDNSTEALVASNMYEDTCRTSLCVTRWRFATTQLALDLLADAPTARFDRAHQLPSNMLMLHAVTVSDLLIEYNIYGDKLFSNASSSDSVVADYTFRADESDFPSYFILALEYALASQFAVAIARDENLSALMEKKAQQLMQQAKTLDSQQQTTKKLATSRFITTRRSY